MNEHAKKGQELEELAELLQTVVDRKQQTGQAELTAEEEARYDALLAREDVRQQLRDRPDLTDLMGEIAEWDQVCVATVSARDNSKDKLLSALREANIKTGWMSQHGGTLFVCVRKRDQARALGIIAADAKEHGYWVWLFHEVNPELRDTSQ
jgi:hypothetical protein